MTTKVELVFFEGCPHAARARERLRAALSYAGQETTWTEWDTMLPGTPASYRRYSSPTVLVDGTDVSGGAEGAGVGCAMDGGPTEEVILQALRRARR